MGQVTERTVTVDQGLTDQERFLAAIFAEPDEDTPRLAYADWLDEHGDPARAEFVRVQVELAGIGHWAYEPADYADHEIVTEARRLDARARELFRSNLDSWIEGLPGTAAGEKVACADDDFVIANDRIDLEYTFRRGFPEIKPGLPVGMIRPGLPVWIIEGGLLDTRDRWAGEFRPSGRVAALPDADGRVDMECTSFFDFSAANGTVLVEHKYHLNDFTRTCPERV